MGADNWTSCPKCMHDLERVAFAEIIRVQDLYGKVPVEEFDAARAALPSAPNPEATENQTFREDYELGTWGSPTFTVRYKGHCDRCGLHFEFKHEAVIWEPPVVDAGDSG